MKFSWKCFSDKRASLVTSPPLRATPEVDGNVHRSRSRSLHGVDVDGSDCGAQAFLSPTHVVSGFHLACIQPQEDSSGLSVTLFVHGQSKGNHTLSLPASEDATDAFYVRRVCSRFPSASVPYSQSVSLPPCLDFFHACWCPINSWFGLRAC